MKLFILTDGSLEPHDHWQQDWGWIIIPPPWQSRLQRELFRAGNQTRVEQLLKCPQIHPPAPTCICHSLPLWSFTHNRGATHMLDWGLVCQVYVFWVSANAYLRPSTICLCTHCCTDNLGPKVRIEIGNHTCQCLLRAATDIVIVHPSTCYNWFSPRVYHFILVLIAWV